MKKKVRLALILFLSTLSLQAQNQNPWTNALMIAFSQDGTSFLNPKVFQDSSGVPSIARHPSSSLIAAFQWFPAPLHGPHWDSVAVKFSSDNGVSWTKPKPIKVAGFPLNFQRPFDPAITVTDDGKYRIYFSSGPKGSVGLDGTVNTYSALSSDGINYQFDADARFDHSTKPVIDPTVTKFNGLWHYIAPKGAPQEGAFHATAADGLVFTPLADIASDNNHNWTGNTMLENPSQMRFYGSGPKIWWSVSSDGASWSSYTDTNIQGGDPAVLKLGSTNYLIIYVGKSQTITAAADNHVVKSVVLYPNPAREAFYVSFTDRESDASLSIFNSGGQEQWTQLLKGSLINKIDVSTLPVGVYYVHVSDSTGFIHCQSFLVLK